MRELDPDLLERLRHSGLRLDREGRWWHEGQPVEHPRLAAALHRWLDRQEDGRYVVRLDAETTASAVGEEQNAGGETSDDVRFAYVEVEDAPYVVRSVRTEQERMILRLSDGSEEELEYVSLRVGNGDVLYCRVKRDRFDARLSRNAQLVVAQQVEEGQSESGFVLVAGGGRWPIGARAGVDGG
jgi:hypothetical protein